MSPADTAKQARASGYYLLPAALRNFVRSRETGLVLVAIVIGLLSGLLVAGISKLSVVAHALLFDIPFDAHLSSTGGISWQRTLLIPVLGGAILAAVGWFFARRIKGQQLADAIEANALYGGRVSFRGSVLISMQTLLSNGFGGSVGLEAGYTQICSAFGSHIGQRLAARRSDMRLLVACGAAGAISAAENVRIPTTCKVCLKIEFSVMDIDSSPDAISTKPECIQIEKVTQYQKLA